MEKVDPFNLPSRPMTMPELQYWILFTIAVAGKGAKVTEQKMVAFLRDAGRPLAWPFKIIQLYTAQNELLKKLKKHKLGKYTLLMKGFPAATSLDLNNLDVPALEKVPGIGPKGARMIMMYGFPDQKDYAVLDTHVLKFMRAHGYDVPDSTPSGKQYEKIEHWVIAEARARNMTPRQFDTMVWQQYAKI
jgi:hypothetical protein